MARPYQVRVESHGIAIEMIYFLQVDMVFQDETHPFRIINMSHWLRGISDPNKIEDLRLHNLRGRIRQKDRKRTQITTNISQDQWAYRKIRFISASDELKCLLVNSAYFLQVLLSYWKGSTLPLKWDTMMYIYMCGKLYNKPSTKELFELFDAINRNSSGEGDR